MALTGSMRDFGISEILQLIGHQKKSGVLAVSDKNLKVEILFDQGGIVGAKHEPARDHFDLGGTLIRSGQVSREQMAVARKEHQESLRPLEQILLKSGVIDLKGLRSVIQLVHLEILYSLFLWRDGDYSFEQGPISYPQQWTEPISSEHVLMDGYRIKDEWPQIESVIPDALVKLELSGAGAGGAGLDDDHRRILALVDGSRTAEDIIFLSRMGKFETLKVLKELIEQGRLNIAGAVARGDKRDVKALAMRAAAVLVMVLGLAAILTGGFRNLERMFGKGSGSGEQSWEVLQAWRQVDKVSNALSLFAAVNGGYPETLHQLVTEGELSGDDLESSLGAFEYEVLDGGRECRLSLPASVVEGGGESGDDG